MIILANLILPLIIMVTTVPSVDKINIKGQHVCQGRYELYFSYTEEEENIGKLTDQPCQGMDGMFSSWICNCSFGLYVIMASNLCELYFYGRCIWETKVQTERAAQMMTANGLMKRKR